MKRTTCGRWAHLACALWTPETITTEEQLIDGVPNVIKVPEQRCFPCTRAACMPHCKPLRRCCVKIPVCLQPAPAGRPLLIPVCSDDLGHER